MSFLLAVEHAEHALGHQEAAEDVDRSEGQSNETESARPDRSRMVGYERDADREQRANHDHRGDGIGHRHQRRMQRRRHRPNDEVADKHREHENRQAEHEWVNRIARRFRQARMRVGEKIELAEDRKCDHARLLSALSPRVRGEVLFDYAALFGLKFGCTTAPSRVSAVALTMSSSQLTASALVFLSIRISRNA